jgi:type II secretory pathway pseudopilin PulG
MSGRQSGHTVLELLVVAMVLMILAAIVLPSGSMGVDRKLDTVQLEIQDAIDHAQSLAYHRAEPFGVRFGDAGDWFAVVDRAGAAVNDPLSRRPYVVRLDAPGQPSGVRVTHAEFGGRPLAAFNEKGILNDSGQVHLRVQSTERWLAMNTASPVLAPIPISP